MCAVSEVSEWPQIAPGVVRFPSGARIRGRALATDPVYDPDFGIYLAARPPRDVAWPYEWVMWRDFWLPDDSAALAAALGQGLVRAQRQRVEIACFGGLGRTGTALACAAVIDGLPAGDAVDFVREQYHPNAVQTPWQRRFVRRFDEALDRAARDWGAAGETP